MTSDYIKMCVAEYFRYTRQCPIISFERSVIPYASHNPDILVVSKDRRLIEIEVKISLSDFRADAKKRIWKHRDAGNAAMPYQFYYAVPYELKDKVEPILRPDCGLLLVTEREQFFSKAVFTQKRAPINKRSQKLSLLRATRMAYNQTGTLCSLMETNYRLEKLCKQRDSYVDPGSMATPDGSLSSDPADSGL